MATVALQLTAIIQEPLTGNQNQSNAAHTTPVNPNQAQAVPAQQDTVTLTPQAAQNQLNGQGQQAQQQPAEIFVAEAIFFAAQNPANNPPPAPTAQQGNTQNANAAPQPQQDVAPPAQATAQAAGQTVAPATGQAAAQAAAQEAAQAAATTANTGNTAQQQLLAQLDQVLQQLGLNPAAISLSNQLAMLAYINDPAALEAFVQQLAGSANQTTQTTGNTANTAATNATNTAATTPATNDATAAQNANAPAQPAQPAPLPAQTGPILAEIVVAEFQVPPQTNANQPAAQTQPAAPANTPNPPANNNATLADQTAPPSHGLVIQFQELQLAFGAAAGTGSGGNTTSGNQNPGTTINVTI